MSERNDFTPALLLRHAYDVVHVAADPPRAFQQGRPGGVGVGDHVADDVGLGVVPLRVRTLQGQGGDQAVGLAHQKGRRRPYSKATSRPVSDAAWMPSMRRCSRTASSKSGWLSVPLRMASPNW